jgi:16S rRNA pseudouridine516 synthase
LLEGVQLHDEPAPSLAINCVLLDATTLRITIDEGKYHQVKRMVAAAGNRVEALHREAVGNVELPEDLGPGEWRWVSGPVG